MIITLSGLCLLTDMVPQAGTDRNGAAYKAGQQHIVISLFVCTRRAGAGQVGGGGGSHVLADEAAPGQLHIIIEPAHLICILLPCQ